jgi:hypothetical protein
MRDIAPPATGDADFLKKLPPAFEQDDFLSRRSLGARNRGKKARRAAAHDDDAIAVTHDSPSSRVARTRVSEATDASARRPYPGVGMAGLSRPIF